MNGDAEYRLTPLPEGGAGGCFVRPIDLEGFERTEESGAVRLRGRFDVPPLPEGGRALLRMDGVGCFATVRVNGAEVCRHAGGHTVWECAPDLRGGESAALELLLESGETRFSPYQTARVLRGVRLVGLPRAHVRDLAVRADWIDGAGTLALTYGVCGEALPGMALTARLLDAEGGAVSEWPLAMEETQAALDCPGVLPWDAEHPALYTLQIALSVGGETIERTALRVGFTGIAQGDPRVLWNGRPLKLRGVNYREPLPSEGRDLAGELALLKGANVNFLRSLYVPFSEACLSLCDEIGFYVEQCAPFWDVDQGISSTQNTPGEREAYRAQFAEMLLAARSHPCVALWSLGGDSTWGANFREGHRLAKRLDGKRPVNFYYAMTVPEEEPELDVWSVAYADWRQPMDAHYDQMTIFHTHGAKNEIGYATGIAPDSRKPVLHIAFAPPPCYNRDEIDRDPGVREFWGESIGRFWRKMWAAEGCLGGAVMAAVDEDGAFSTRLQGFAWGVLDAKGQPKPEYHHLRMAYAPVVAEIAEEDGEAIEVALTNRFVHTDLSETSCRWQCGSREGVLPLRGGPGERVNVRVPLAKGERGGALCLLLEGAGASCRIILPLGGSNEKPVKSLAQDGGPYQLHDDGENLRVESDRFAFVFGKTTGRLTQASAAGARLLTGGPFLQATRLTLGEWSGCVEKAEATEAGVRITLLGQYGAVCRVRFTLDIGRDGRVGTRCDILTLGQPMPHAVKAGVGVSPGGLNELGIAFLAAPGYASLRWKRDALHAWYPDGHIGRAEGAAARDDHTDFTAMKHHVREAALQYPRGTIDALPGAAGLSVRVEPLDDPAYVIDDRDARLTYTGVWHEMDDACGNHAGTESLSDEPGATAALAFTGTGVRVYGPKDMLYGDGEASVDGGAPVRFSQYLDRVDREAASRGHEKRYGLLLFAAHGLPEGPHTLLVRALGEKPAGAQGAYISIDRVVVESGQAESPARLILNQDFNYARLVRGNYMRRRVAFAAGDSVSATIRLGIEGVEP